MFHGKSPEENKMLKSKTWGYLPTRLMCFFWDLHDLTRCPLFEWIGNWMEDTFEHQIREEIIQAREDYLKASKEVHE
jgi:hypothetical protein